MAKYKIVDGEKQINGKAYAPGDVVDVSADVAARLRLQPVAKDDEEAEKSKGKGKGEK